jgi:hypothetical protein
VFTGQTHEDIPKALKEIALDRTVAAVMPVEEVIYVLDIDAAFQVAGPLRKAAYGREDPQVTSTLIGTPRLAFPELLIEIKIVVRV